MEGGLLSLKWNDHSNTFFDMLSTIRRKESYCDVTLVSDGRFYPVHKLVLSTCSEFFDNLFSRTDCKHPVVIVANVSYKDLEALLNYMYLGEVNVLQNELGNLMKAAEVLRVKGLAENKPQNKDLRDTYRSSPSEFTDAGGKRKRSEDVNSPTTKRSAAKSQFSSDPQALKNTVHDNAGCSASETSDSKEPFSSSKGLANVPPAPSQEPGISAASRGDSRDQGSNDKAVRPEVKVEEILIKDEPGGWFGDCEEVGENVQFSEPDTSLDYNPQSMDYSGSCLPWELPATTQPHPIEGHLPQGMPGASGMQGMQEQQFGPPANASFKTAGRGFGKVYVGGFTYTKNRTNGMREYWRCKDRRCPGRLILYGKEVIKVGSHTHPPDGDGRTSSDIILRPDV